jgi:hypothetical protein
MERSTDPDLVDSVIGGCGRSKVRNRHPVVGVLSISIVAAKQLGLVLSLGLQSSLMQMPIQGWRMRVRELDPIRCFKRFTRGSDVGRP